MDTIHMSKLKAVYQEYSLLSPWAWRDGGSTLAAHQVNQCMDGQVKLRRAGHDWILWCMGHTLYFPLCFTDNGNLLLKLLCTGMLMAQPLRTLATLAVDQGSIPCTT